MSEKLFVHADFGDGTILLAGQLIVDNKLGRFKYAKAYINHPRAFALDPINLPNLNFVLLADLSFGWKPESACLAFE